MAWIRAGLPDCRTEWRSQQQQPKASVVEFDDLKRTQGVAQVSFSRVVGQGIEREDAPALWKYGLGFRGMFPHRWGALRALRTSGSASDSGTRMMGTSLAWSPRGVRAACARFSALRRRSARQRSDVFTSPMGPLVLAANATAQIQRRVPRQVDAVANEPAVDLAAAGRTLEGADLVLAEALAPVGDQHAMR